MKIFEVKTATKTKLCRLLEQLNHSHNGTETVMGFVRDSIVESEEQNFSTQFLLLQNIQFVDLQEHFERYCNGLPIFWVNSAYYDLNLIKPYLFPILISQRDLEPTVIKEANQLVSFRFGDIHILDIMNFLGGATNLDSSLKTYKTNETKVFFPYEGFDCKMKLTDKEFPPCDSFFIVLRTSNPLGKDYIDFENFLEFG